MKRKATDTLDTESSDKISKEALDDADHHAMNSTQAVTDNALTSPRLASGRQRKAPAWLSSYVTDGNTSVKESPKSITSTSTSPVKKKEPKAPKLQPVTEVIDGQANADESAPSLRRGSTLKIEDSPPHPTKNQKSNTIAHSISVVRKDTEILSSSTSDSCDSPTESKQGNSSTKVRKEKSLVPENIDNSSLQSSNLFPSQSQNVLKVQPKVPSNLINKTSKSNLHEFGIDTEEYSGSNVMEVCNSSTLTETHPSNGNIGAANTSYKNASVLADNIENTSEVLEKPKMLEIVICISTSGAMRDYLTVLQEKTKDLVWRLQSLIPDLRIGVIAHTQGGIHDDKPGSGSSAIDHNYIRTGGHSGTKWLDLGATFSQICAFVDSLEPEATIYPDYVQDNLEMALWKLQRCMSWSSCSYRTVVLIGRGRPNRTSFYLQKEHWRGWIRSALEIGHKTEIPIIDWELEAKLLSQMGIHVFTIQASSSKTSPEEDEDEGSTFFRRVAEITNALHIKLTEANNLVDIIVGVCCACHGPDLLQTHRDTLRDENDGVLPPQLKDVFVSLQLHSKRRSLSTIPSLVGDLSILKKHLAKSDANGNISSSEEDEELSEDEKEQAVVAAVQETSNSDKSAKTKKAQTKLTHSKVGGKVPVKKPKVTKKISKIAVKSKQKVKKLKLKPDKSENKNKNAKKVLKGTKIEQKPAKKVPTTKTKANKVVLKKNKNVSKLKKETLKKKLNKKVKPTPKKAPAKNKT